MVACIQRYFQLFVESTVYFPSFYLYSHYILAIENTWVLAVLIGIGYFLSQLAFQRDRLECPDAVSWYRARRFIYHDVSQLSSWSCTWL